MNGTIFIDDDNIYEVTVGIDPKTDLRYTLGRTYMRDTPNEVVIEGFIFDSNMLVEYGIKRIIIRAKNKEGEIKTWKDLIDVPITITSKV